MEKIRLQKYLSQKSICSRRRAEELVKVGLIKINGKVAKLGNKVDDKDKIEINNKLVVVHARPDEKIYIILNKPVGYICTKRKFKGEKNIYELLPKKFQYLNPVGRLDKNSEGLLILTNDGDYLYKMTHPKFEQEKEYIVETHSNASVHRKIEPSVFKKFKQGINIGEQEKEIVSCKNIKQISNKTFNIIITQGKKRQIRRMCEAVGLKVAGLKRVREGKIKLEELKTGKWETFV